MSRGNSFLLEISTLLIVEVRAWRPKRGRNFWRAAGAKLGPFPSRWDQHMRPLVLNADTPPPKESFLSNAVTKIMFPKETQQEICKTLWV